MFFFNKVDRGGADVDRVTAQVRQRLGARPVLLTTVTGQGRREARVHAVDLDAEPVVAEVAEVDDAVAARWLTDRPVRVRDVRRALRRAVRRAELVPVVCGSAITGAGVRRLCDVLADLLPYGEARDGPPAGTVFAVDRDGHGRRVWLRLWSGRLRVRDRVQLAGGRPEPVTEIAVIEPAGVLVRRSVSAGQIAAVRGVSARIGQHIGDPPRRHGYRFPPPTRQAVVEPVDPAQRLAMFAGLAELADEDPLVDLRLDEQQAEAVIRLHGEVQKEVLASLMEDRYGVRVRFSGTLTACIERVAGTGAAEERVRERGNPYLAGLGLRIEAAPAGHGIEFRPGIEPGRLPPAFVAATEEGVRAALRQGRNGWPVTDCTVTMTASRYWPRQSRPHQKFDKSISTVAADFRNLAPVVVAAALRQAGTRVCQPIERFDVNLPRHAVETVLALLGRLGAVVHDTAVAGGYLEVSGTLPSARVPRVVAALPDLTGGEAVLTTTFDHYAPVTGEDPPALPRRGPDPDDREAWFRAVPR
ncbi:GTP-binding protein [Micromonospora aurantiaca (nom. illeg.)]|uniref:GTP-binding protein n=1 Tax=Micromonospora aurantiaca (nom. illeg.) TaxID=47850 RepID=UPI0033E29960